MMTDDELRRHVSDELAWEPKVDGSEVAVSAEDGLVTLRGTVGSFRQKREARKAAERVRGVIDVNNQLEVRILTEQRRENADVRGDVLQALLLDANLPTSVDATVKNGSVTLCGAVDWEYQRDEASFIAGNVLGVAGVDNQIYLNRHPSGAGDVQSAIEKAFLRDARLDPQRLTVATSSGTVTLTGTVRSCSERDAAVAAAWAAPGVRTVNDRITVTTRSHSKEYPMSISTSLLWRGLLAIAVGAVSVAWPGITVGAFVILFAIYAFIAAGMEALRAFSSDRPGPVFGYLLLSVLSLAAGIVALAWPGITALVLVIWVAAWAGVTGVVEVTMAFRQGATAGERTLWALTGLVSIALAVVLFIRPDIGAVSLATVFGLFSIFYGVSALVLSFQARNVRAAARRLLNTPA